MKSENKYWEFTEEEMHHFGHRLRRIRALINLPERRVKKGDIGGWVSDSAEISGLAWVYDEARVAGSAEVFDLAWVCDGARVCGEARVYGSAWVAGLAEVSGEARVKVKSHVMTLTSIGSKDSTVNLVRTEKGHYLQVGCWEGTVQTLMEEVYKGSEKWVCDAATKQQWIKEYQALEMLAMERVAAWERARSEEATNQ